MGRGYFTSGLGVAALEDEDRLCSRQSGQHSVEALSVLDALNVGRYYLGFGIMRKILEQVALVDIAGISIRDRLAESDASLTGCPNEVGGIATALADEPHLAHPSREVRGE